MPLLEFPVMLLNRTTGLELFEARIPFVFVKILLLVKLGVAEFRTKIPSVFPVRVQNSTIGDPDVI
jgi:hypothetical protein